MTVMRAIVKGTLEGIVQVRNMFTCDVVPAGGDTTQVLWDAYLTSVYDTVLDILSTALVITEYELQAPLGSQWETTSIVPFPVAGTNAGGLIPNAVAVVFIAKALGVRHLGRKFFSGNVETNVSGNALITTAMSAAAVSLLAYITPFTGIGGGVITPGIRDASGTFRPFVGGSVSSLLGSMRRRKPGIGI